MKRINLDRLDNVLVDYINGTEHKLYEVLQMLSGIAGSEGWEQTSEELEKMANRQTWAKSH